MTDAGRGSRERIRLQAVEWFEDGQKNKEIAVALRVSEWAVERWRRAWREWGEAGVLSRGSPGRPRLRQVQMERLERELERGPVAHGWADQRWGLARIKTLIGRLFHVSYTVEGTWLLLKRNVWSWKQLARRAIERDEDAVELWKKEVWRQVKQPRRRPAPGSLRGRGGAVDDAAARGNLGPDRADPRGAGPWTRLRPGLDVRQEFLDHAP